MSARLDPDEDSAPAWGDALKSFLGERDEMDAGDDEDDGAADAGGDPEKMEGVEYPDITVSCPGAYTTESASASQHEEMDDNEIGTEDATAIANSPKTGGPQSAAKSVYCRKKSTRRYSDPLLAEFLSEPGDIDYDAECFKVNWTPETRYEGEPKSIFGGPVDSVPAEDAGKKFRNIQVRSEQQMTVTDGESSISAPGAAARVRQSLAPGSQVPASTFAGFGTARSVIRAFRAFGSRDSSPR